jgi:hypothetical protein
VLHKPQHTCARQEEAHAEAAEDAENRARRCRRGTLR